MLIERESRQKHEGIIYLVANKNKKSKKEFVYGEKVGINNRYV